MPSTRNRVRNQTTSSFSPTDTSTWHQALVAQLYLLPAKTLQLQLTAKNLISTGNRSILVQRLYNALRRTETLSETLPSATSMMPTMSVDTQQSTTSVTTSNPPGDQQTCTTQSAISINTDQDSALHPNILLLAASQLSTTPINSSLVQHQHPTVIADSPTTTPPQDDRLSEASAIPSSMPPNTVMPAVIPPSMLPNTVIPPTTSTLITPDPVSSLPTGSSLLAPWTQPPVPACLCERILAGEFIDFNNLLTGAMFSTHDGPSCQSTAHSLTLQMSPQGGRFEIAPAHNTTHKINSFSLWMEAWNVYASTLLSANPSRALELFGYQRLITSANLRLLFSAWISYDTKFRTLAVNYPSLCWDVRHPDLWLECMTTSKPVTPDRWPCQHCNSIYHFPNRCPFRDGKTSVPNDTRPFSLALPTNPQQLSQSSDPHSRQPNPPPFLCRDFNNRRRCIRNCCNFHHLCERCGGSHPKLFCPNPTGQST